MQSLHDIHRPPYTEQEITQTMDMFDKKMDAKDFKASEDVRRPLETALQDNKHFYGNDRAAMVNDIAKMTPEEQKKYREDKEYRKSIDDKVTECASDVAGNETHGLGAVGRSLDKVV